MLDAGPLTLLFVVPVLALGGALWPPVEESPPRPEGATFVVLLADATGSAGGTFIFDAAEIEAVEAADAPDDTDIAWALAAVTLLPAAQLGQHELPTWMDRMTLPWRRGWKRVLILVGATKWISSLNVLEQDNRQRIHRHVRERPGIHAQELADALGLRRQTVLYHLRVLEEKGILTSRLRGRRYYYCTGVRPDPASAPVGPVARALLGQLQSGARPKADLAKAVGISPRGVGWHLQRLAEDKVITCVRQGSRNLYALARDASDLGRDREVTSARTGGGSFAPGLPRPDRV